VSLEGEREADAGFVEPRDQGESPFDWLATRELREVVQNALQQVPDVYRAAVILRDLDGLSYEEVGEVLDISVGTVKSRMIRGRRLLREILEPVLHGRVERKAAETAESGQLGRPSLQNGNENVSDVRGFSGWTPQGRGVAGFPAGGGK
jgi:hypothetical protein